MSIRPQLESARASLPALLALDGAQRAALIRLMAAAIRRRTASILQANADDVATGTRAGLSTAMLDRLTLDEGRIEQLAQALEAVAEQPDPLLRYAAMDCDCARYRLRSG